MTASTPEDTAFALLESGDLVRAEAAWREILARKPDDPDALHLLGVILAETGRGAEGLALLDRAVQRAPRVAAIRGNRAAVLGALGRNDEAMREARRALDLEPGLPAVLKLLGDLHLAQGRSEEAASAYRRALEADPRMTPARVGLGSALLARGDREGARRCYEAAIAAEPRDASGHFNLAALAESEGHLALAEAGYRQALACEPGHVASLNNLGVLLRRTEREDESIACFERALALAPSHPDVLSNMGIAHQRAGRTAEAIAHFGRALAARPGFARALVNWGNALQDLGRLDEAAERYREAEAAAPGFAEARYAASQVALRQHRFAEGWDGYEARFDTTPPVVPRRSFAIPELTPANLAGARRVAVWSAEGLGDRTLHSTLLPEFESLGIEAVVEIDARLAPAYRRRFPGFSFLPAGCATEDFGGCDHHVALASLARLFRRSAASFERQPKALFTAEPGRAAAMRERLGPGRWVAIAWRSLQYGERRRLAERKSIPLEHFAILAGAGGARLLDLQYGDVAAERAAFDARHRGALHRVAELDVQDDLEGVLAAIAACELVITPSHSLAHLAGALGKPTWLACLGGREPFHYWVPRADGRSIWYPSVEVVTDPAWSEWPQAFEAMAARLAR